MFFEVVEGPAGHVLRPSDPCECLGWHAPVLELTKHELIVTCQEWATRVTVVYGIELLPVHLGQQVMDQNRRLCSDGCSSLTVRHRAAVTEREDVLELHMLRRGGINLHPPSGIRVPRGD